jgi:hypothetical protein
VLERETKSNQLDKFRGDLKLNIIMKWRSVKRSSRRYMKESLVFLKIPLDMCCAPMEWSSVFVRRGSCEFLLSDFVDADHNSVVDSHDKVYVFKQKDIQACVTGKSNKDTLLTAAKTCLF